MRHLLLSLAVLTTVVALPSACNRVPADPSASSPESIATDLPDDGGTPQNSLFWANNGRVFRGRCLEGSDFTREECSRELVSMSYDTFKVDLDGGLSETIRELAAESRRIQDAIALIERDLAAARAELDALEARQGGLSAELSRLRSEIIRAENNLAEYREQLVLIDEALSQAADQDISAMRPIVLARLADWQSRLAQINGQLEALLAQVGSLQTEIEEVTRRMATLTARISNLQIEFASVNQRLEMAYGDFSVYEETVRRLNSGITYTVLSTNTILARQRLFIKRFEAIFERNT